MKINARNPRGGEACVQYPDGTISDSALHEEMTAGVDDSDIRAKTRSKLLAAGVPAEDLNRVFPDLPPIA